MGIPRFLNPRNFRDTRKFNYFRSRRGWLCVVKKREERKKEEMKSWTKAAIKSLNQSATPHVELVFCFLFFFVFFFFPTVMRRIPSLLLFFSNFFPTVMKNIFM